MFLIQPLSENVLVDPLEAGERTSEGGIVIPATSEKRPIVGRVVRLGNSKKVQEYFEPHGIEIGDHIIFQRYGGHEVTVDEKHGLQVIPLSQILCKLVALDENGNEVQGQEMPNEAQIS